MNPEEQSHPIQAIIYCQVSSKGQETDGHGLESQETRCRQHAQMKGYEVAAVFPDTMTGGGDFMKRPGMVALLSFIDAQPDENFIVIFDDLKRASRDTRAFLDLRDAFRLRNVTVECLNFQLDDTPEGEFLETIFAAQGQLERKQNGRQVAQKMKARMENGYWVHDAPVGYRYDKVKGRGKMLFPNPPLDHIVREAFEGFASGRFQTQAEVRRFFESFPDFPRNRKGEIPQQRVTDVLTNPIYTGHICSQNYKIHWLKAQHEPLATIETFDKVQERRQGVAKAPKRKNIGNDFALRGFVCCADCGVPYRSSWAKGRDRRYPYYLCQTKGCDSYGKSIARYKIEGDVGALIKSLQPSEGLFTLATAMFRHAWDARANQAKEMIQAGKREIAKLDRQIDTLLDRIVQASNARVISTYEMKIADLEREKLVLAEKLANQAEPPGAFEEKLEPVLTFLASPWKLWETGQVNLRRTVLKLVFADRLECCRISGPRTAKIAMPFKALEAVYTPQLGCGAVEKTRTSTRVTGQRPQRCASTNSATTAKTRRPKTRSTPRLERG